MVVECKEIFTTFLGSFVYLLQNFRFYQGFLMYVYLHDSAHDFLPLNFPNKKKVGKIPF